MVFNHAVEPSPKFLEKIEIVICCIQTYMNEHKDIDGRFFKIVKYKELYLFNVSHRFCKISNSCNANNNFFFIYIPCNDVILQKCYNCGKNQYYYIDIKKYICSSIEFEDLPDQAFQNAKKKETSLKTAYAFSIRTSCLLHYEFVQQITVSINKRFFIIKTVCCFNQVSM